MLFHDFVKIFLGGIKGRSGDPIASCHLHKAHVRDFDKRASEIVFVGYVCGYL